MTAPITFPNISPPQLAPPRQSGLEGLGEFILALQQARQQQQGREQAQQAAAQNTAFDNLVSLMQALGFDAAVSEPSLAPHFERAGVKQEPLAAGVRKRRTEEEQQLESFLGTLPLDLARAQRAAFKALQLGSGKEQATNIASVLMEIGTSPETLALIDEDFPELAPLPAKDKTRAFVEIRRMQAEARVGLGPEGERQRRAGLDAAREEEARLRRQLVKLQIGKAEREATRDSETTRNVLAYLQHVDRALGELWQTSPELLTKPASQRIAKLFGQEGYRAYLDARRYLERLIPPTTPQGGAPPQP